MQNNKYFNALKKQLNFVCVCVGETNNEVSRLSQHRLLYQDPIIYYVLLSRVGTREQMKDRHWPLSVSG